MIGKEISHYRILEELGRGGMGVVYKAHDTKLNRDVALKFLPHGISGREPERSRFLQEAQAAAALNHSNICAIHSIGEEGEHQFIDMEFVDGKTIREIVPVKKLQDAIGYAIQIAEALEEAHIHGIVHRDVKAENIMVNTKNQVKVMDFGLAKLKNSLRLTKSSSTVGTLAYMAPEQIQGGDVDARADIFSFGVLLFEMLTGRLPFRGEHEAAMVYSIMNEDPEPLQKYRHEVPSELLHVLDRALEKDKEDRYQSVHDMLIDLRRLSRRTTGRAREAVGPAKPRTAPVESSAGRGGPQISRRKDFTWKKRMLIFGPIATVLVVVGVLLIGRQSKTVMPAIRTQLSFVGNVRAAAISPDGKTFAYSDEMSNVFIRDIAGGEPRKILDAPRGVRIRFSPLGSELVTSESGLIFSRFGGKPRKALQHFNAGCWSRDGKSIAWVTVRVPGVSLTNLTTGATATIPVDSILGHGFQDIDWSPVADILAGKATLNNGKRSIISTISLDGLIHHTVLEDSVPITNPRWGAYGDAIYYLRQRGYLNDLMKVSVTAGDGGPKGPPAIVQAGLQASQFDLSADGTRLVCTWRVSGSNLWTAGYEGRRPARLSGSHQITTGTSLISGANISPDGGLVAFRKRGPSGEDIFLMPLDGGEAQQVTFQNSVSSGPVWSPDGKEIAFVSDQGATYRVWIAGADGRSARPFTKSRPCGYEDLAWSPGSSIIYRVPSLTELQILDPTTGIERSLAQCDSGWIMGPCPSSDGRTIAAVWNRYDIGQFIWMFSTIDPSQRYLLNRELHYYLPIAWSPRGESVYACEFDDFLTGNIIEITIPRGEWSPFLSLPSRKISCLSISPAARKIVWAVGEIQSDVWLIENFDPQVE